MKKIIVLCLCMALLLALVGCGKTEPTPENIVFTGVIEEVSDRSILVTTTDEVGFDRASVSFAPEVEIASNLLVGQTVRLTILPQIAESYPVQVTAVGIKLITED